MRRASLVLMNSCDIYTSGRFWMIRTDSPEEIAAFIDLD